MPRPPNDNYFQLRHRLIVIVVLQLRAISLPNPESMIYILIDLYSILILYIGTVPCGANEATFSFDKPTVVF